MSGWRQSDDMSSLLESLQILPFIVDKDALRDQTFTLPRAFTAPLHIFILGSGAKSRCPYLSRWKSERGYGPAENFTCRVLVDSLFKPDNDIRGRQLAQVLREHSENDAATRAEKALQQALSNN